MLHFVGEKRHGSEDGDAFFVLSLPLHSTAAVFRKRSTRRCHAPLLSPIASELAGRMSQTTRPLSDPVSQSRPLVSVCILYYPYLSTCSTFLSSRFTAAARVFSDSLDFTPFCASAPVPPNLVVTILHSFLICDPLYIRKCFIEHQKDRILDSDEQSE